uniref:Exosome complex component 10 homolog n=1 Tax=Romanomermis culicivorax TaxID=13658 RepID=A0A915IDH0_ROMCU
MAANQSENSSKEPLEADIVLRCLMNATKCANNLPKIGQNFELYSSYPLFADLLKTEGHRLKTILSDVLKHANCKVSLNHVESVDEMSDLIEKASDCLAERIANCIDEADGRRKQEDLVLVSTGMIVKDESSLVDASWNKPKNLYEKFSTKSSDYANNALKLLASKNVVRPQLSFQHLIDNSNRSFISKLKFKHNASLTINQSRLTMIMDDNIVQDRTCDTAYHPNPYKYELDHYTPDDKFLERCPTLEIPAGIDKIPFKLVEEESELQNLCRILKNSTEFAVDLEAHTYRTFQGLTCLMQVSVDNADYVVDTLKLWPHMHILNDPFTDPKILKVFHGAYSDVEWLQRDFGIYVVNMFDTGQAMRVLGMAHFSLAFLIKSFLNIDLKKEFQLADWRIRPLPKCLLDYAREDTRYLLYCYRRLKNELLDAGNERKNLLISVFERSRDLCAKHYEKSLLDPDRDYLRLCAMTKKPFNSRQKMALKELYAWRDATARLQDESIGYVLPNHMLLQIAEVLPREMQGLLSCCNPVPPLVRQDLHDLHKIVVKARQSALEIEEKASLSDSSATIYNATHRHLPKPHDFSHVNEDEELVPRTASADLSVDFQSNMLKSSPKLFTLTSRIRRIELKSKNMVRMVGCESRELETSENFTAQITTPYEMFLKTQIEREKNVTKRDNEQNTSSKAKMYNHLETYRKIENVVDSVEADVAMLSQGENFKRKRCERDDDEKGEGSCSSSDEEKDEILETAVPLPANAAKRLKKKKKKLLKTMSMTTSAESPMENFDYSQAVKEQKEKFAQSKNAPQRPTFDPHKDFMKQKPGKKGRKFGKRQSKSSFGTR